jgi:hypothetical protein
MEVTTTNFQINSQSVQQANNTAGNASNTGTTFSQVFASYQSANTQSTTPEEIKESAVFKMNTSKGDQTAINLDEYLTPGPQSTPVKLGDIPLLLPTAHNIEILSKYSQEEFKDLLAQYDIPSPPATVEFDNEGQVILPADYAYADQLKQALSENPTVENALRTTAALASHYAGIMEGQPFRDEMSTARTQADRDRIIEKYSELFDDNRPGKQIILTFLEDGNMLVGERKV